MKRSTLSLWLTLAVLAIGAACWLLLIAPRLGLPPYVSKPAPPIESATSPAPRQDRNSVLNLYLAAPRELPKDVVRAELTLLKATLTDVKGNSIVAFEGSQRVMLQKGIAEQAMSERIPDGHWTKLFLEFSPAAELAYANGSVQAALLGRKRAGFGFYAEVETSRSLAVLVTVPLEPNTIAVEHSVIANIASEPRAAETYVFGGFMLEPRDRGEILEVAEPTLNAVIKKDLGFDLSIVKTGSSGFQPAQTNTPQK